MLFRQPADRGAAFFASPGRQQKVSGHGGIAKRYQVQIDGGEVKCHDEIVSVRAKKQPDRTMTKAYALVQCFDRSGGQGTSASALNPIDFVSVAGLVMVQKIYKVN